MRLTRVYVEAEFVAGSLIDLPKEPASHLAKVLRAREGDAIVLFNGDGREFSATIDSVRGARVSAAIGSARSVDRESPLLLTLIQCIPRGDRMDFIVQKATELGVVLIVPVLSQRSVVRLDASQSLSKQAHWQAVAVSACEQCGRNRLPRIEAPQLLLNYLGALPAATESAVRLVLEPGRAQDAAPRESRPIMSAHVAIGPEGGFADDELEAFRISSFTRMSMGPRILRTETAAIAAVVMLQTRHGDLSAPSDAASRDGDA